MPITTRGPGARRRALAILTAAALAAGVSATTATANPAEPAPDNTASAEQVLGAGRYVVLLHQPGATRYDGGVSGLAPTQAPAGGKFNARSGKVKKYERYLERKQGQLAASVDAGILSQTTIAASSFTAQLDAKQATKLAADRDVLMLVKDTAFAMDTWNTPRFLGLESAAGTGKGGVWEANRSVDNAGKGVVVGILDSGIWPESASFAGQAAQVEVQRQVQAVPLRLHDRHGQGRRHAVPRCLRDGRAVGRLRLQREAHRGPLLPRGVRRQRPARGPLRARVHLPP